MTPYVTPMKGGRIGKGQVGFASLLKRQGRAELQTKTAQINNDTPDKISAARRTIEKLLTAANSGTTTRIMVHVVDDDAPVPPFDANGTTDTLFAALDESGGLDIAIGIRTHWTMLWHFDFRMPRARHRCSAMRRSPTRRSPVSTFFATNCAVSSAASSRLMAGR